MRIKTNLLPKKYICLRRDDNIIIFAFLIFIFVFWISLKQYFYIENKLFKLSTTVSDQITKLKSKIAEQNRRNMGYQNDIRLTKFDEKKKKTLKEQIDFFNLDVVQRKILWYEFFHQVEMTLPEGIWIKAINLTRVPTIKLDCEAEQSYFAPQFLKNLIYSPYFSNEILGDSEIDPKTKRTNFNISFVYTSDVTEEQKKKYYEEVEKRLLNVEEN